MDTKIDRIFSSFYFSLQTIEIPMPYSSAKLEQLFFLSLSNIYTFFSIVRTVLFRFMPLYYAQP